MEEQTSTNKENYDLEKERKEKIKKNNLKIKRLFKRGSVILIIVLTIFGIWKLAQQPSKPKLSSSDILQIQNDDWIKGNPNAEVVLVEYLDFECEACGAYYPLVKRLTEEYGDGLVLVSRYFPLPGHKNAMTSALAVESAGKQGKYWEMHDLIFEEQQNWGEKKTTDKKIFEEYAKQLDLNMEQFKRDVDSQEVKKRVIRDWNSGRQLGVNGTPTFFLNNEKIQNPRGYEAFKLLLDSELAQ